jgi:hypothetical protein
LEVLQPILARRLLEFRTLRARNARCPPQCAQLRLTLEGAGYEGGKFLPRNLTPGYEQGIDGMKYIHRRQDLGSQNFPALAGTIFHFRLEGPIFPGPHMGEKQE